MNNQSYTAITTCLKYGLKFKPTSSIIFPSATSTPTPSPYTTIWCTSSEGGTTPTAPISADSGALIWKVTIGKDRNLSATHPFPGSSLILSCIREVPSCCMEAGMKSRISTIFISTASKTKFGSRFRKTAMTWKFHADWDPPSAPTEITCSYSEGKGWLSPRKGLKTNCWKISTR